MSRQSSKSPARGNSERNRNKNSIIDWIDDAVYEFLSSGEDQVRSYQDLEDRKDFKSWYSKEQDPAAAREAIRNRFKYLRRLRKTNYAAFVAGNQKTQAPATVTPPRARALPARDPSSASATAVYESVEEADAAAVAEAKELDAALDSDLLMMPPPPPPPPPPQPPLLPSTMSLQNAFNTFDFNRPENNPFNWWIVRNSAYMQDGMTIDKVEAFYPITDIRDAIHTDLSIAPDGNLMLHQPRTTAYIRTNIGDMHHGTDQVIRQAHEEAITRMRANGQSFRSTKFYIPAGTSIRTSPFSTHLTQIRKYIEEGHLDFGEVGNDELPILHEGQWLKFVFAINRPMDTNNSVHTEDVNQLANHFGDLGM